MKFMPLTKLNISLLVLTITFVFMPTLSFAGSTLVIDEFRVSGEDSNDEYIVLANYGTTQVDLAGYRLIKRTSTATEYKLYEFASTYLLRPKQRIVVAHSEYTGISDFIFTANTIANNNSIYLLAPDKSVIDLVGYGDATYFETSPVTTPEAGDIYARVNGLDSDNNNTDFKLQEEIVQLDVNADNLVISELLPSPANGEEWFELFNPTNLDILLINLKICDVLGSTHCYYFDETDIIVANSYKIYFQSLTKLTLNNSGDYLELYDISDNLITDSGGNYGDSDKGISLALFGSEYLWTKTITPAAENVFSDIIEIEDEPVAKTKTTKSRVATSTKKAVVKSDNEESEESPTVETSVKGAETTNPIVTVQKALINREVLGWGLIGLAILLVLSYTLWYFRDYAKNIYNKIRHRDDSARF